MNILQSYENNLLRDDAKEGISAFIDKGLQTGKTINDKKALITGFSGIGFAYAKHLANNGWHLDLVSQNKDRALSALQDLDYDYYLPILAILVLQRTHKLIKEIPTPDLLIANAGNRY